MNRISRFSQRSLHGLKRRLGAFWRRYVGNRFVPPTRVRRITLNGRDFKRVTFSDSAAARRVADRLERFRHAGCFPGLVAAMDAELLLEFVPGRPLETPFDAEAVDRIGRFYGALYSADPRRVVTVETPFPDELQRDLAFLRDVGVLDAEAQRDLSAAAQCDVPEFVYLGWDYLDPLPRNFVVAESGRLIAVDVESLEPDRLLGGGLAKSLRRGAEAARAELVATVERESELSLEPQLPFAELHFLAGWTKHAYLKGRGRLVDASHFECFREKKSALPGPDVNSP